MIMIDAGDEIGALTIVKSVRPKIYACCNNQVVPQWLCKCDCGEEVVRSTYYFNATKRRGVTAACNRCALRARKKRGKNKPKIEVDKDIDVSSYWKPTSITS